MQKFFEIISDKENLALTLDNIIKPQKQAESEPECAKYEKRAPLQNVEDQDA